MLARTDDDLGDDEGQEEPGDVGEDESSADEPAATPHDCRLSPTLDDLERPVVDRLGHLIVDGQTLVQGALFHNVHTRPAFPSKRPIKTLRTASGEIPPGVSSCHSPSM